MVFMWSRLALHVQRSSLHPCCYLSLSPSLMECWLSWFILMIKKHYQYQNSPNMNIQVLHNIESCLSMYKLQSMVKHSFCQHWDQEALTQIKCLELSGGHSWTYLRMQVNPYNPRYQCEAKVIITTKATMAWCHVGTKLFLNQDTFL